MSSQRRVGVDSLHMKVGLTGEVFTMSRNYLTWGFGPSGDSGAQRPEHQK